MRMYDCSSGAEIARLTGAIAANTPVYEPTIAWSPDSKQFLIYTVTGLASATIFIWRVA